MDDISKLEAVLLEFPAFIRNILISFDITEKSKISYAHIIKIFLKYVSSKQNKDIVDVSIDDLDDEKVLSEYLNHIKLEEITKTTYANRIKVLKVFFDYMYREGAIRFKYEFPVIKRNKYVVNYTETDYIELIKTADTISSNLNVYIESRNIERDKLLFSLLYDLGLKTAECIALMISDIDLEKGVVRINRDNETFIKLNDHCFCLLLEYYDVRLHQGISKDDPFLVNQQKMVLGARSIEKIIENITNEVDDRLTPAILRLLCGAKRYIKTGDLMNVAQYLGIKYPTAEEKYICIKNTNNASITLHLEM